MLFNSYEFLLFFPIVLIVYFVVPRKIRYICLLIASYYFYMGWNARYAILLAVSTFVTWLSGILIDTINNAAIDNKVFYKKLTAAVCFIINLGILGFFKYFDFVLNNINAVVTRLGGSGFENRFSILLPVGISFYTFQALSYTVDVYRGEIAAEKNILKYALFVSFFPQLVAGPIERSGNLLNQVQNVDKLKLFNLDKITGGAILMLWGFFMKLVIADRVAILVDTVYDSYWIYGSVELILASILFAIQIYCDFGGYSLIAIGASKVMGFDIMENFNTPYFATSIKDFWRRWHISLSTWFRDYLYIPLGGSRCSKLRNYANLIITFLVSGLWHGASWHYVAWGGLHGIYQVVSKALDPLKKRIFGEKIESTFSHKLGQIFVTFVLADIAWVFFRADNMFSAITILKNIVVKWNPWALYDGSLYRLGLDMTELHVTVVAIVILFLVDLSRYITGKSLEKVLMSEALWFRWATVILLFFMILTYGAYGPDYSSAAFIYFQFQSIREDIMTFNSIEFLIFFPIVILGYYIVPAKIKNLWLLISSYYFYMCWNAKYIILIIASTVITYLSGLMLERIKGMDYSDKKKLVLKNATVAASFITNIGILGYFKYTNFIIDTFNVILAKIHVQLVIPNFDILLPVGISFYTFQALSYTMDVYRDEIYAEKNFVQYALFVSFFPQLVAGPIERSKNLLKQLAVVHKFDYEKARSGFMLFLWGMFLKIVIADRAAIVVETIFDNVEAYNGAYIVFGIFIFAAQLYGDFYGYSIMAKGAALFLGIELMENFQYPYYRTSIADHWRGWHISLTTWFRDYLYFPLGGSRKGKIRKYINILIVFFASGVWHGASWHYVLWGLLVGAYQVVGEALMPLRIKLCAIMSIDRQALGHKLALGLGTFILTLISYVFFRANSASEAVYALKSVVTVYNPWVLVDGSIYNLGLDSKNITLLFICIAILMFADYCKLKQIVIHKIILEQNAIFRILCIATVITFIVIFGMWGAAYDAASFIYFQF